MDCPLPLCPNCVRPMPLSRTATWDRFHQHVFYCERCKIVQTERPPAAPPQSDYDLTRGRA